jgi:hypothetical protein
MRQELVTVHAGLAVELFGAEFLGRLAFLPHDIRERTCDQDAGFTA